MENQMSLIEIALEIMDEHKEAIDIYTLIEETLARKGVVDTDGTYAAKLYTDITTSSKFVFMGENKWDLKSRQSLDQFDKDGSSFNSKDDYDNAEEEDDDLNESDLELEDADDYDDDEDADDRYDEDKEDDDEESDLDLDELDEEDDDEESYDDNDDEEKYNKYMDDYEDLYED
ncbi:MAG: DNA-directed RNA polymerase subunit delta [Acholeplasmatales bacterium]|nr:DNA-directed RNA polymerase subunit delta [Acholeplasmatales bacterium]